MSDPLSPIEARLWAFERKYGVKSADFHRLATDGELQELDGSDDHLDLIEWLGLCTVWLNLKEETVDSRAES